MAIGIMRMSTCRLTSLSGFQKQPAVAGVGVGWGERASEVQKWRDEEPRNLSLAEVAEVGEVTLMLNPGAVTHLKQCVYGASIATAFPTFAKKSLLGN